MKSHWMVFAGSLLVIAGLADTLYSIHQTASPFDRVDDVQSPVSVDTFSATASYGAVPESVRLMPASAFSRKAESQQTQLFNEPGNPTGAIPDRLVISAISLDVPIISTKVKKIDYLGQDYYQWLAPNEYAVGWHDTSALLGQPGNTVLNGHHNIYGNVFEKLVELQVGEQIDIFSGEQIFSYKVSLVMVMPERFKSLSVRLDNARWILPTADERLTLITCWPPESNTHRVIVVALPVK